MNMSQPLPLAEPADGATPPALSEFESKLLRKAISALDAIGARYKIIVRDGEEFGELSACEAAPERKPRRSFRHHYHPIISKMNVGDYAFVPVEEGMDARALASSISAWAVANWGRESTITHVSRERNVIEIARLL